MIFTGTLGKSFDKVARDIFALTIDENKYILTI
jgi:hypothetical protein